MQADSLPKNRTTVASRPAYIYRQRHTFFQTERVVYGLVLIALLFSLLPTGLSWEINKTPDMLEGSWIRRVQWVSLYALTFFILAKAKFANIFLYVATNPFIFGLLAFVILSSAWSDFSNIVIRQGIQYIGILAIAILCAHTFSNNFTELFSGFLYVLLAVFVSSVILVIVNPTIALEVDAGIEGAWRGVMEHKNLLGIACGVSLLIWTVITAEGKHPVWFNVFGLILILICLIQTKSSTSLFFGVTSSVLFIFLHKEHIKSKLFIFRVTIALLLFISALSLVFFVINDHFPMPSDFLAPFSALFGKGSDLTGRGDIWIYMRQSIESHPWLGVGYASFWLGIGGPSQYISDALKWNIPSAHNGYLDLLNELGIIGFSLFVLQLIFHVKNLIFMFSVRRAEAAFHFCLLYIFLVSNSSESQALRVTSFLQFIVFISILMVHHFTYSNQLLHAKK